MVRATSATPGLRQEARTQSAPGTAGGHVKARPQSGFGCGRPVRLERLERADVAADEKVPLRPGTGVLSGYELGPAVGRGAFAIVRVARRHNGLKVAIKVYEKSRKDGKSRSRPSSTAGFRREDKEKGGDGLAKSTAGEIRQEARVLSKCHHENVVAFVDFCETETQAFLITEYIPGGSLKRRLEKRPPHRLPQNEAQHFFQQIANAVAYLHDLSICHRDLKLENLLLERDQACNFGLCIKVIDFGFAVQLPPGVVSLRTFCGTPPYMSPQMVAGQPYGALASDVWALGVLLYVMLIGRFPFCGDTKSALFACIRKGRFRIPDYVPVGALSLITQLLEPDGDRRPTAAAIAAAPWLTETEFCAQKG